MATTLEEMRTSISTAMVIAATFGLLIAGLVVAFTLGGEGESPGFYETAVDQIEVDCGIEDEFLTLSDSWAAEPRGEIFLFYSDKPGQQGMAQTRVPGFTLYCPGD